MDHVQERAEEDDQHTTSRMTFEFVFVTTVLARGDGHHVDLLGSTRDGDKGREEADCSGDEGYTCHHLTLFYFLSFPVFFFSNGKDWHGYC